MKVEFSDFCVCVDCRSKLAGSAAELSCTECGKSYEIRDGIARLMPSYEDTVQQRYKENYERIARNFISKAKYEADNVAYRHDALLRFMGRKHRGKKVLDIGSSHALYLGEIDADLKVAMDIAETYLELIPESANVVPVLADAETYPFKPHFFDVIIIADILEHLLHPERLVELLAASCNRETRIFVHVPWEENLEPYLHSEFEFAHLRSFNAYTFSQLWHRFYIKKSMYTYPDMRYPMVFNLERYLPRPLYNALVKRYFHTPGVAEKEAAWRQKCISELPKREWILLRIFKPIFRMFELRLL